MIVGVDNIELTQILSMLITKFEYSALEFVV